MSKGLIVLSAVVVVCLFLACLGTSVPIDVALNLLFGWAVYLYRVLPRVTVSGEGVATAGFALVGFLIGLHYFLKWLTSQVKGRSDAQLQEAQGWRPGRTVALAGLVLLMFVTGISAVGISHQTAWLFTSPEPIVDTSSRGWPEKMASLSNLKQIGLGALHNYHDKHQTLPPGGTFDSYGNGLHGWQTLILPFLDGQEPVYASVRLDVAWAHPDNVAAFRRLIPQYRHPGVREVTDLSGFALSHYASNARVLGGDKPRTFDSITDGRANTLLVGEAGGNYKPWGHPTNWRDPALGLNRTPDGFGGPGKTGAQFVYADGSVRFISNKVHPDVLKALSTPDGGEEINDY